tara:strand:+ start:2202 stop:5618 length:3417 start_codon:yes stop_codon:yes gene_type:complete
MKLFLLLFFGLFVSVSFAQELPTNFQSRKVAINDTIQIDSVSINPIRFQILDKKGIAIDAINYEVNFGKSILILPKSITKENDSLTIKYLRYPEYLTKDYFVLDSNIIVQKSNSINKLYSLQESTNKNQFKPFDGLNTLGSISRGITVGNNQNAVVNSELNLQITGKLSDKVSIRASIQDANIPSQGAGYSQSLDEFDQIFIELYSDNWNIRAGDVDLVNTKSYFGNFTKKVQGISLGGTINHESGAKTNVFASGALVRGVFSSSDFVGQEGNQGPYKLVGPNGELYILIVSGSERVYVNGLLLSRGEGEDYVIDYNAGEVKFNATYPITANMRIRVEYQYTDRNYTRFIGFGGGNYTSEKLDIGAYVYSESDAKNQPLQQSLTEEQVAILKDAGDNTSQMIAPSAVPDIYSENKILYKKEDINGMEAFVFSNNAEDELYSVRFTLLGEGLGNYIVGDVNAINRIFEYVEPIDGQLQGNYEPVIQLTAPTKIQVGGVNGAYHPTEKTTIGFEVAGSVNDLNLFSDIDNGDNNGFAGKLDIKQTILETPETRKLDAFASINLINEDFRTIERLYSVEFNRDWNLTNPLGDQRFIIGGLEFLDSKIGNFKYEFQNLDYSENFSGNRNVLGFNLRFGKLNLVTNGSSLQSKGSDLNSKFFRIHNVATYTFNKSWLGGKLALEDNQVRAVINDSLTPISQKFNAYEVFTGLGDSTKVFAEVGYRYRVNDSLRNSELTKVSTSNDIYLKSRILNKPNSQLSVFANYRILKDEDEINEDEKSLNSRLLYNQSFLKNSIRLNTAIETNNGVLPQQEFTYVKVAPGEGIYTWNDYNDNGIQELEEFELAQFQDEAEYIRVLLPNQIFVKISQTKISQTLTLNPQQWSTRNDFRKVISHFYNQTSFLIDKKVRRKNDVFIINPFEDHGEEELSSASNFRNALFYNRGKQKFTTTYTFLLTTNRNFLSVGLAEIKLKNHQLNFNHKFWENWLLNLRGTLGENKSLTENFESRNYTLDTYQVNPKISYLLNSQTRFDVFYQYLNKENQLSNFELLTQQKIGVSFAYSNAQKISLNGEFNYINNDFTGNAYSPVAYQMLEGLQPNVNLTWRLLLQKRITKFLDVNLSYFGRKSETFKAVHTGSVQLRAYF